MKESVWQRMVTTRTHAPDRPDMTVSLPISSGQYDYTRVVTTRTHAPDRPDTMVSLPISSGQYDYTCCMFSNTMHTAEWQWTMRRRKSVQETEDTKDQSRTCKMQVPNCFGVFASSLLQPSPAH